MTNNVGEIQTNVGELHIPKPLDPEIMGGIAIVSALHEDTVEQVALQLQNSFDVMRAKAVHPANVNRTKEMGHCIAYSILQLDTTDVELIDNYVTRVSRQQNHGMQTTDARLQQLSPTIEQLWLGQDSKSKHTFKVVRSIGSLVLDDGSIVPNSSIWALKAVPNKPSFGWL